MVTKSGSVETFQGLLYVGWMGFWSSREIMLMTQFVNML